MEFKVYDGLCPNMFNCYVFSKKVTYTNGTWLIHCKQNNKQSGGLVVSSNIQPLAGLEMVQSPFFMIKPPYVVIVQRFIIPRPSYHILMSPGFIMFYPPLPSGKLT